MGVMSLDWLELCTMKPVWINEHLFFSLYCPNRMSTIRISALSVMKLLVPLHDEDVQIRHMLWEGKVRNHRNFWLSWAYTKLKSTQRNRGAVRKLKTQRAVPTEVCYLFLFLFLIGPLQKLDKRNLAEHIYASIYWFTNISPWNCVGSDVTIDPQTCIISAVASGLLQHDLA